MTILTILKYPDERLRKKSLPVPAVDDAIRLLLDNMLETMYDAPGVGLAAPQVNIQKRVVVIDISEEKNDPLCLINPEIIAKHGTEESEEGCLSVPDIFETIARAEKISVRALNREGETFELEADGLLAVCIQHELDHLEGKLFVDYLSPLKLHMARKKKQKAQRKKEPRNKVRARSSADSTLSD